jgi:hypothetical protein
MDISINDGQFIFMIKMYFYVTAASKSLPEKVILFWQRITHLSQQRKITTPSTESRTR